ncbi:FkbM family methyltransferase [Ferrovibrio terrae]|uniref:FkbM family methyltransferase n=1 Tax=Ferrovibrio terrae TaxID=2594003 RepID=UPI003137FE4D
MSLADILAPARLQQAALTRRRLRDSVQQQGCLLFGAGNNGRQLARRLADMPDAPALHGFISDVAADQGRDIAGLPVWSRSDALAKFGAQVPVVNCVYRADVTIGTVMRGLNDSGFARVLSLPDLYTAFDTLPPIYGYGTPQLLRDSTPQIARVEALLADDLSRTIFRELVNQRVTLDFTAPRMVDRAIYFPAGLVTRPRLCADDATLVFVDCGAYTGDTLEAFAAWHPDSHAHAVAFEPDPASFAKLQAAATRVQAATGMQVSCVQAAAGAAPGRIGFLPLGNEASHTVSVAEAEAAGGDTVALDSVDHALSERGLMATYVKYDVEGFEREAIAGTHTAITRDATALAVSVYHRPDDLWDIPLLLHGLQPRYDFFLREHGPDGVDTVLYALRR